ncbi:MAG TPA: hypothetical protein VFX21_11535, partial [Acidimicrobiia bacterium]|nr:hypothetical protein [Acidimicrobiia bacterium]
MADDEARENDHEGEAPVAAPAPGDEVAAALLARFDGSVNASSHGQPVVYVDRAVFADVARYLRDEEQFSMLCDITAVDHLLDGTRYAPPGVERLERFEAVANYLSH